MVLTFAGTTGVGVALMIFSGTAGLVVGAWILGLVTATAMVGWMVAFDVHALTWLWGSLGEEQTAAELVRLGPDWFTRHDVARTYGNWDHITVGPAGVFMIDTKRLNGRAVVKDDGLSSGRLRCTGGSFRGSSVALRNELLESNGPVSLGAGSRGCLGDFPQRLREDTNVELRRRGAAGGVAAELPSANARRLHASAR